MTGQRQISRRHVLMQAWSPARSRRRFLGLVEPCHPTLREKAPAGGRWIHEIKFDGYRTQAHLRNGRLPSTRGAPIAQLGKNQRSRAGLDRTEGYRPIRFRNKARD
jgi:hypothetical protein